ncbi:hypothetical protein P9254_16490 [Mesorhizobium sp. WSM4983]|nr:hypothetical protein [Mesorhizobium sp. WSM4982]MDG4914004.1 hypothetical protein [Mesorhizobium sp. WSM4983]
MPGSGLDDDERRARQEAHWLVKEFGAEAQLYAAMKAEKAIEQKDFGRCAPLETRAGDSGRRPDRSPARRCREISDLP